MKKRRNYFKIFRNFLRENNVSTAMEEKKKVGKHFSRTHSLCHTNRLRNQLSGLVIVFVPVCWGAKLYLTSVSVKAYFGHL